MIQITSANQFKSAAERAQKERMLVQPAGLRRFFVTNRQKETRYEVFFCKLSGKFFGVCNCAAGTPMHSNRIPLMCKHLYAAYLVLRALTGKVNTGH